MSKRIKNSTFDLIKKGCPKSINTVQGSLFNLLIYLLSKLFMLFTKAFGSFISTPATSNA